MAFIVVIEEFYGGGKFKAFLTKQAAEVYVNWSNDLDVSIYDLSRRLG